ncbi:hypothetical protein DFH07DRAFT_963650 [Mycena maculata]|uniref:Uncharacterized protein n=1 Tax=Mycena maculata TaxID=230809 RepID=A0AAD7IMP6_9AGAR|nr:hypothetical protein DFH07DRAFT_963650 [Mycena maculata]
MYNDALIGIVILGFLVQDLLQHSQHSFGVMESIKQISCLSIPGHTVARRNTSDGRMEIEIAAARVIAALHKESEESRRRCHPRWRAPPCSGASPPTAAPRSRPLARAPREVPRLGGRRAERDVSETDCARRRGSERASPPRASLAPRA